MIQILKRGGGNSGGPSLLNNRLIALRAVRESIRGIVKRSEIQKWRDVHMGRGNLGTARIIGGSEKALLDFLVSLNQFCSFVLRQLFQLLLIEVNRVGEVREFKGKQIGVRQAHRGRAHGLRKSAAVNKVGVGEMGKPIEIVVRRMINAGSVFE